MAYSDINNQVKNILFAMTKGPSEIRNQTLVEQTSKKQYYVGYPLTSYEDDTSVIISLAPT